jgi:hypothetical protein
MTLANVLNSISIYTKTNNILNNFNILCCNNIYDYNILWHQYNGLSSYTLIEIKESLQYIKINGKTRCLYLPNLIFYIKISQNNPIPNIKLFMQNNTSNPTDLYTSFLVIYKSFKYRYNSKISYTHNHIQFLNNCITSAIFIFDESSIKNANIINNLEIYENMTNDNKFLEIKNDFKNLTKISYDMQTLIDTARNDLKNEILNNDIASNIIALNMSYSNIVDINKIIDKYYIDNFKLSDQFNLKKNSKIVLNNRKYRIANIEINNKNAFDGNLQLYDIAKKKIKNIPLKSFIDVILHPTKILKKYQFLNKDIFITRLIRANKLMPSCDEHILKIQNIEYSLDTYTIKININLHNRLRTFYIPLLPKELYFDLNSNEFISLDDLISLNEILNIGSEFNDDIDIPYVSFNKRNIIDYSYVYKFIKLKDFLKYYTITYSEYTSHYKHIYTNIIINNIDGSYIDLYYYKDYIRNYFKNYNKDNVNNCHQLLCQLISNNKNYIYMYNNTKINLLKNYFYKINNYTEYNVVYPKIPVIYNIESSYYQQNYKYLKNVSHIKFDCLCLEQNKSYIFGNTVYTVNRIDLENHSYYTSILLSLSLYSHPNNTIEIEMCSHLFNTFSFFEYTEEHPELIGKLVKLSNLKYSLHGFKKSYTYMIYAIVKKNDEKYVLFNNGIYVKYSLISHIIHQNKKYRKLSLISENENFFYNNSMKKVKNSTRQLKIHLKIYEHYVRPTYIQKQIEFKIADIIIDYI